MITEAPKATGSRRDRSMIGAARIVGCALTFLGLIGMLRIGTTGETRDVATFLVAPFSAIAWFVIGMAGIATSVAAVRARLFLIVAGAVLALWGLIGLVTDASDVLTSDPSTVALLLVLGVGSLGVALGPTPDFVEKALALPDAEAEDEDDTQPVSIVDAISDGISAAQRRTREKG
jgi:hypothetical protein